jgi:hypothetical protein
MDSKNRDEARDLRREETLARRMGEALDRFAPGDARECPDAESLAAYHERALAPEEMAQWEGHFAACSRCRKILAVLAASDDTPLAEKEVERLGELVASTAAPPKVVSRIAILPARPNRFDWRVRWVAPALGVAAVLAVWFAMRPPWRSAEQAPAGTLIAQAPVNESPLDLNPEARVPSRQAAPSKKAKSDELELKDRAAAQSEPLAAPADAPAKKSLDADGVGEIPQSSGAAGRVVQQEGKQKSQSSGGAGAVEAPAPPPAPQAAASAMAYSRLAQPRTAPQSARQAETATESATNAPIQNQLAPRISAQAVPLTPVGGNFTVSLVAPSGRVRWEAGRAGIVQRSVDGGQTWVSQTSPLTEDWEAGAAISDTICWLAGDRGAIARSVDANHWVEILPPPASADANGNFPDWIRITANSAQSAVIEARDGRRFVTEDGGKTWRVQ